MIHHETFEAVLIGPDGTIRHRLKLLNAGEIDNEILIHHHEGPFALTSRYRRTDHKVQGRIRFDWVESTRDDNGEIYRLASVDGLGAHNLVNDPD